MFYWYRIHNCFFRSMLFVFLFIGRIICSLRWFHTEWIFQLIYLLNARNVHFFRFRLCIVYFECSGRSFRNTLDFCYCAECFFTVLALPEDMIVFCFQFNNRFFTTFRANKICSADNFLALASGLLLFIRVSCNDFFLCLWYPWPYQCIDSRSSAPM